MEELEGVEIIVGYGVQWDTGSENLVQYRDMDDGLNEEGYISNSLYQCGYNWLVKLAVF